MITLNGKKYAKNDSEFVSELFQSNQTCVGFYKVKKDGILLMNEQKIARVFIKRHVCSPFAVSVCQESGKIRYMHGMMTPDDRWVGFDVLSRRDAEQAMLTALKG